MAPEAVKLNAVQISEHVYWVGAIDWAIRDFHGYATGRGTTYNAYLIMGDVPILIDTVKAPFLGEMLSRIRSVIDPSEIRYIVSNHAEMDHSGCLPQMIERVKPEQVFASPMGVKALGEHFDLGDIATVCDGDSITIGGVELSFLETRMLHWPDSMFTYYGADEVLFSSDAFGMHLAGAERFVDELRWDVIESECGKYYANILLPFSKLVTKLIGRVGELNLPMKVIASDHGPIWREQLNRPLELYAKWAQQAPTMKAVVAYDTMWGSTASMAEAVTEGLVAGGATVRVFPLGGSARSDVATELLDAGAFLVGSPTLNRNMFPTVADVLTYIRGLQPKNLIGAAFGSYGWSSKAVGQINEALAAMGVELVGDGVGAVYVPGADDLERCQQLGREVAAKLAAACEG